MLEKIYSILGVVVSGLIIFSASTYYTEIYKQPRIDTTLTLSGSNHTGNIYDLKVENKGALKATNVVLTLNSSTDIIKYSKTFSNENITTLKKEGQRSLVSIIPRLTVGGTIILNTILKPLKVQISLGRLESFFISDFIARYISCNTILAALDGAIIQLGKDHSIL